MTKPWVGIGLICFFLPWLELSCDSRHGGGRPGENGVVRFSQSGFQMAYGGVSRTVRPFDASTPATPPPKFANADKGARAIPPDADEQRKGLDPCPLMAIYGIALVGALVLALHPSTRRRAAPVGWALSAAAAALVVQALVGFPLWDKGREVGRTLVPSAFLDRDDYCAFTLWFWASWLTLIGAAVSHFRPFLRSQLPDEPADAVTSSKG
jgi:hypothetical protein